MKTRPIFILTHSFVRYEIYTSCGNDEKSGILEILIGISDLYEEEEEEEQEVENKSIIHLLQHLVNGMECPSCSSRDIEFIESSGHRVCVSCGTVLEENAIVSSVEFQECGDRSHVVGQFVSATSSKVSVR